MTSIRPAAVAGSFYPTDAEELSALLGDCFNVSPLGPRGAKEPDPSIIAGLSPNRSACRSTYSVTGTSGTVTSGLELLTTMSTP